MKFNSELKLYEEQYREQIISLWERSVRATHNFVLPADIDYFKQLVMDIDFNSFPVYCLLDGDKVIGFIGVEESEIVSLFLDPAYIGKGYGKKLMNYALTELNATRVEVNEQNVDAVNFYSKFGFVTCERTEKDGYGKDYPILKMKLKNENYGNYDAPTPELFNLNNSQNLENGN